MHPIDINPILKTKKYTVRRMVREAERFFVSVGWPDLPKSFMEKSMFVKPTDTNRKVACHPAVIDFKSSRNGNKGVR